MQIVIAVPAPPMEAGGFSTFGLMLRGATSLEAAVGSSCSPAEPSQRLPTTEWDWPQSGIRQMCKRAQSFAWQPVLELKA